MRHLGLSTVAVVAALSAILGTAGCEKDTTTVPTPMPTPTVIPKVTTVIVEGTRTVLNPITCEVTCLTHDIIESVPFKTEAEGVITAIVDWTDAADTIYVALAVGTDPCVHNGTFDGDCDYLPIYDGNFGKPASRVSGVVPARDYTLYVINGGPHTEAVSYQVLHTK